MHENSTIRWLAHLGLVATLALPVASQAATYTVNTTDADAIAQTFSVNDASNADNACDVDPAAGDQGVCTLTAAIQQANIGNSLDTIEFDNGITTLALTSSLPSITDDLNIEGRNNGDGDPEIVIDGDGNGGFVFAADAAADEGSSIVNLVIIDMGGDGITLDGTPYILDNLWVGVDASGNVAAPNDFNGILVQFSTDSSLGIPTQTIQDLIGALGGAGLSEAFQAFATNAVAAVPAFEALFGNDNLIAITNSVLSGNDQSGLRISGGLGDTGGVIFAGNKVGTNADGDQPLANGTENDGQFPGIHIDGGAYLNAIIGNVVAANHSDGILVEAGAVYWPNLVGGNFVGVPNPIDLPNPVGITADAWGNYDSGIRFESAPDPANPTDYAGVIAANVVVFSRCGIFGATVTPEIDAGGIAVTNGAIASDGVVVSANLVGVANFPVGGGLFEFGNQCDGLNVSNGTHQLGGPNGADANVIGANAEHGILLRGNTTQGNTIQGNLIGRDFTNSTDTPNGGHGIFVNDSGGNLIGGPNNLDRNVIAHNGGHGIKIFNNTGQSDPHAWANLMQRNQIFDNGQLGIDLDDPEDLPNDDQNLASNNTALDPVLTDDTPHAYANFRQNAPQMTGASYAGGMVNVSWSLASAASTSFRIEAFAITDEGAEFLGEKMVVTDAAGLFSETDSPVPGSDMAGNPRGKTIVMTATALNDVSDLPGPATMGPVNNTSEFSNGIVIPDEIRFSAADYPVGEGVGDATITLQRVGSGSGAVQVTLSLADTSTEAGDHGALAPSVTVTWADTETGDRVLTLPIVDDVIFEATEVATLDFAIDSGTAVEGTPATATVTITDNELPPTLAIVGAGVAEGGQLVWTVTRTGDTDQTVSATYAVTAAAGTEAGDFAAGVDPLNGMVSIAPNATTATISILAVDDAIDEPSEDVTATLSAPVNATLAGGGTANAAIADGDAAPVFAIDSPMATETDANTSLAFTVTRTGDTEFATSVDYTVAPDTATTPEDYLGVPDALSGTLPFAAAQTTATITLTLVGDDTFEAAPPEQFTATLSNATNATIGTPLGTATITDDDAAQTGEVQFSAATFQVNETEAAVNAVVVVDRVNGTDGPASVDCAASAGTATAGADFTAGNVGVSWAAGEGGSKQCLIPIAGDALDEADETVSLALANVSGATVGNPANATLTILDNDAMPVISLSGPAPAAEGDAPTITGFVFTATLSAASGRDVTGLFATTDGTAMVADSDYAMLSQPFTITAGNTSAMFTVNVTGDATDELDETFTGTLSDLLNATPQDVPEIATATILNDDAPPPPAGQLRFTSATWSVGENGATAVVSVERVNGTAGAVAVDCTASAGTAGAADATFGTQTLNWADTVAGTQDCSIAIADDLLDEDDETVLLALSNATNGATLDAPSSATLTITDDDAPPVISIADFSQAEGDGPAATVFGFDVTLSAPSGRTVTVQAGTGGGNAGVPGDYASTTGTVTFAPGVVAQPFAVNVVGDTADETNETFDVTLSAPVNATLAADAVATGTIVNDDAPAGMLQFSAATYSVGEAGVQATITVTRMGGSTGAVTVQYGTANGSATAGADYTAASGMLSWADQDAADKTFTVPVTDDAADEPDETVLLSLASPTGGAALGVPVAATLTITDDDAPAPAGTLQFSAPTYGVGEAGVQATITVTRTGGSTGAVTVQYGSTDGSATAGADYTAASGTLSWADQDAAGKTFTVPVTDDAADEPDETVLLSLASPTGGAVLGAPVAATLTITDNDAPSPAGTLQFSAPTYGVGEAGAQATVTVTRTGGSTGAISVQYASADGSATAGSDYTTAAGTLNWADQDAAAKTFTVPVTNDATDEPDETITLTLSTPGGGAVLGSPATALLTITDDDSAAAGPKTFNGQTATGTGPLSVTFTGGGDPCGFTNATQAGLPPQPLPAGQVFPHGVLSSTITNCTVGATLAVTATYPQALPAGTQLWKYGRTLANQAPHWYAHPSVINGNTISFTLVDGGAGDDDLVANGTIVDPVGPAFAQGIATPGAAPITIPATDGNARLLMLLLVALAGLFALRQRR